MTKSREASCVVLIATQNQAVRRLWKQELQPLFIIQMAATISGVHQLIARSNPSILLLDLALLGFAVARGIAHMLKISPATKILTFREQPTEGEAATVLKAGARGYCDLHLDLILLRKAIQMVQKGEVWIKRDFVTHIIRELTLKSPRTSVFPDSELKKLTEREREIAISIANGASNKEIANQLNITEKTVKAHLTSIFLKLGVSDRLHLALLLIRPQFASSPKPAE